MIRDVLEGWIEEDDNYKKMDPDEKAIRADAWGMWNCANRRGKKITREAITARLIEHYTFYAKIRGFDEEVEPEFVKQEIEGYKQMIPKLVEEIL